ncbi:hypothetical protein [Arsukibacterium perlucidum]|uniref:hypothetical protein n=1 Tax=Arsukibacterium perlucidum TaxID=368811 RepID=UPI0012F7E94D|nr:hypothetical protein [Arsukibacterium perlucidum]
MNIFNRNRSQEVLIKFSNGYKVRMIIHPVYGTHTLIAILDEQDKIVAAGFANLSVGSGGSSGGNYYIRSVTIASSRKSVRVCTAIKGQDPVCYNMTY